MTVNKISIGLIVCSLLSPLSLKADEPLIRLFDDFVVVQKESAEAKAVRLKWISEERSRIQSELKKFESELQELERIVPRAIQPRDLSPQLKAERKREELRFNDWTSNNDPSRKFAIMRGTGLNTLLRVLGPIAHQRKMSSSAGSPIGLLTSLSSANYIESAEVSHFRLTPATSAGSQFVVRTNQMPLYLEWPAVVSQKWKDDCKNIEKLRDGFVMLLSPGNDGKAHLDQAELLDQSLSLLQAKIQKEKKIITHDLTTEAAKRIRMNGELRDASRYVETIRATVGRLKNVPSDYKVRQFNGGSIEDFLDFCYTHGMSFKEALPADEEFYSTVFRRMQDYAHDVQYVEDWRKGIDERIQDLNETDRQLVWRAADQ